MEYAVKWFNENYEDSSESPQEKSSAFYDEVITTKDLCENPLMLSLMCTIYKNLNYIPKNRADVYEKCADLLFYRWDSSRGIKVELPFSPHLRRIISKLAYLLFTSEKIGGAVRESVLAKEVSDYLLDRCVDSREEAQDISIEMVSFFTGRSWVFTDTGTAANPAENVYQFTHRTFMEYFAACRISETYRTIDDVIELLYPKICTMEWDIVVQLVFNLMDRNRYGIL